MIISIGIPNLHFPLMALINIYGYRVVCVSKLPISGQTLVYGSADGGITIKEDEEVEDMMKRACRILNLKGTFPS